MWQTETSAASRTFFFFAFCLNHTKLGMQTLAFGFLQKRVCLHVQVFLIVRHTYFSI